MGAYQDAYNRWITDLTTAGNYKTTAQDAHTSFASAWNSISGGAVKTCLAHQINVNQNLILAISYLSDFCLITDHERKVHIGSAMHLDSRPWLDGEDFELSWEDIVGAWREAPPIGRANTIVTIDAMRKEIWNEHIAFTDLAFPQGF